MMCCRRDMLLLWGPRPRWRWYGRPPWQLHQHVVIPIAVVFSLLKGMDDQSLTEVSTWSTPEISIALIHHMLKVKGCYPIRDLHNFISEFTNFTKHTKAISIFCFYRTEQTRQVLPHLDCNIKWLGCPWWAVETTAVVFSSSSQGRVVGEWVEPGCGHRKF